MEPNLLQSPPKDVKVETMTDVERQSFFPKEQSNRKGEKRSGHWAAISGFEGGSPRIRGSPL